MKLSDKQIKELAQDLEAGMKIYINKDTLEYRSVLDWDDLMEPEFWEKEIEEINKWSNILEIEKFDSHEGFQIMEDFIDEVSDLDLKETLIKILHRKSPFANFKAEIESSEYRNEWFAFRTNRYIETIKERLKSEDINYE